MTKPVKRTLWALATTTAVVIAGYIIASRAFGTSKY